MIIKATACAYAPDDGCETFSAQTVWGLHTQARLKSSAHACRMPGNFSTVPSFGAAFIFAISRILSPTESNFRDLCFFV